VIPYLGPEFIRALLRQNKTAPDLTHRWQEKLVIAPRQNRRSIAGLLRKIAQHKLSFIAVAIVRQWFA
jgi:hypothetical protein